MTCSPKVSGEPGGGTGGAPNIFADRCVLHQLGRELQRQFDGFMWSDTAPPSPMLKDSMERLARANRMATCQ